MDLITTLMSEHRQIERALDALDAFVARPAGDAGDAAELARFVEFIRLFADARHHGKEEDLLFAAMVEQGFPRDGGPIAVMLHEHGEGRRLVRSLDEASRLPAPWSPDLARRIATDATQYTSLLRHHIHKEDHILYPMARAHLPESVLSVLTTTGARLDEAAAEEGARLEALAEQLAARHPSA